ncbi:hypothetical protein TIFTF001_026589 [Ficus carica]|uniref:Uncharacterized protein n=1 Tax=Ficus carica TaxID=3494 RepID=A0AA88DLI3_FICCA|nr:hypothetical protein TIFTF001_026589 [Ficus carica]
MIKTFETVTQPAASLHWQALQPTGHRRNDQCELAGKALWVGLVTVAGWGGREWGNGEVASRGWVAVTGGSRSRGGVRRRRGWVVQSGTDQSPMKDRPSAFPTPSLPLELSPLRAIDELLSHLSGSSQTPRTRSNPSDGDEVPCSSDQP